MYDKTVRRRRAVLLLLVVLSLILLTAYFRGAPGDGLHSVQRVFLTVLSPVQDGASRALRPVRNLFGWVGSTLGAKGERDKLRKEVAALTAQNALDAAAAANGRALEAMAGLDRQAGLAAYHPVDARVIGSSSSLFFEHVTVNRGTSSGIHMDDPAVNPNGLVGKVTTLTSNSSTVTLITDSTSGVSAADALSRASGIVYPAVGDPSNLTMQYVQASDAVHPGDMIVTRGTVDTASGPAASLFPPNIPIGTVSRVDPGNLTQAVHLTPMADLHNLDVLQILTQVGAA